MKMINMIHRSVQLSGKNGLVDVTISIPKNTSALNVDADALEECLQVLLEENGIPELSDDEVPFF